MPDARINLFLIKKLFCFSMLFFFATTTMRIMVAPVAYGAYPPPGESESLPAVLDSLKQLDLIDEPPVNESPYDPIQRPSEWGSSRQRYKAYLEKIQPLAEHLTLIDQRMKAAPDGQLSLQQLAALSHKAARLYEKTLPQLSGEEQTFHTFASMSKAVLVLDEAVQYWRARNSLTPPFRTSFTAEEEDSYTLLIKLQEVQIALGELNTLLSMDKTLRWGLKPTEQQ